MRFTQLTSIVALAAFTAAVPQPMRQGNGIAIPITKRAGSLNPDKSVNLEELNSQLESVKAKILRGFENFEKNTGAPHPAALKGTRKRATGADALTGFKGKMWYGDVSFGTPPRVLTMSFGTDWSDVLFSEVQCSGNCTNHSYDPSVSSTSHKSKPFNVNIDSAPATGSLYTDTVTITGLTATNQAIAIIDSKSSGSSDDDYPCDGEMGLAFPSISYFNTTPVFQNLVSQGQVSEPVFSFKLASAGGSELFLGGVNSDLYTGDFTYVPLTHEGYWEVNMDGVKGNGKTILSDIDCAIDTGFDRIAGEASKVEELHRALGGTSVGDGWYTFPCDHFPEISLTFGGSSFPVSADTLSLGPLFPGSTDCLSAVIGYDITMWLIGDTFLQNVYSTFDVGNKRVGFAKLA